MSDRRDIITRPDLQSPPSSPARTTAIISIRIAERARSERHTTGRADIGTPGPRAELRGSASRSACRREKTSRYGASSPRASLVPSLDRARSPPLFQTRAHFCNFHSRCRVFHFAFSSLISPPTLTTTFSSLNPRLSLHRSQEPNRRPQARRDLNFGDKPVER